MVRPRAHTEDVRRSLLDNARETVAKDGIEALSLRTLAKESNTSTSAVYSLFGGKDELVREVQKESLEALATHLSAAMGKERPHGPLVELAAAYYVWAKRYPNRHASMTNRTPQASFDDGAGPSATEPSNAIVGQVIDPITSLIATLSRDGYLVPLEPERVGHAIWTMQRSLLVTEPDGLRSEVFDEKDFYVDACALIGRGMISNPGPYETYRSSLLERIAAQ